MSFFPIKGFIFSSLFKKPATLSYPIKPMEKHELVRGQIEIDIENCIFCGICKRKCPTGAIEVAKAEKTWEISRFQCIVCNCCVEVCPKKCLNMSNTLTPASESNDVKDTAIDARVPADA